MLAGTGGADVLTLAMVAAMLLAVGLAAAVIPAPRATCLDPMRLCAPSSATSGGR
jgi:hypothetical protein